MFRIGGTVLDAAANPAANASVSIVERKRSTLTDTHGQFSISALPAGTFTLRATAGAITKERTIVIPAPKPNNYDVQLT
jgi:hypothetical protein